MMCAVILPLCIIAAVAVTAFVVKGQNACMSDVFVRELARLEKELKEYRK